MAAMTRSGLIAAALAAVALTGCTLPGQDDDSGSGKPVNFNAAPVNDKPTPQSLEAAFKRGEKRFLAKDYATACAGFTPEYMKKAYGITPDRCIDRLTFLRGQLPKSALKPGPRDIEATVNGNKGILEIKARTKAEDREVDQTITYSYVLEDGRWRADSVRSDTGGTAAP